MYEHSYGPPACDRLNCKSYCPSARIGVVHVLNFSCVSKLLVFINGLLKMEAAYPLDSLCCFCNRIHLTYSLSTNVH